MSASSGKKAEPVEGGELHVLIKEAKNLVGVKLGAMLDTFVKGFVTVCPRSLSDSVI